MSYKRPEAIVSLFVDKRHQNKNGVYPIKLRICYKRQSKLFSLGKHVNEKDVEKLFSQKPGIKLKDTQLSIMAMEAKAKEIVERMSSFSWAEFEKQLFEKSADPGSLFSNYESLIHKIESEGRISTANTYRNSMDSIKKFVKGQELYFNDITSEFLARYENWARDLGRSSTTISIYLRCLKRILNEAIEKGSFDRNAYPFGRYRYKIPASKNVKKALTKADIAKLFQHKLIDGSKEQKARDFWIFSYLCNGANIKDILKLRVQDIQQNRITFVRSKSASTSHSLKPIVVMMNEYMRDIIDRQGNLIGDDEDYVFPLLKREMTPKQQLFKVRDHIKFINKNMAGLMVQIGIKEKVTTYTARHSFATILKRGGASIEFIAESLGHSNVRTTENYLDSFEDHEKTKWAELLVDFKQ
ncbi:MAG TPA: site-specific integrase [Bacteroidia bacterium]|nr:site-specific integrase [Bacteroidia bacterium]